MSSGGRSRSWRLFVRMGCGAAPEDIKQRSRRCCYRWVAGSRLWLCVCECVEEAVVGMREMSWWQYVLLVVLEGWKKKAPVRRNRMPVSHGGVEMAVEAVEGLEGWGWGGEKTAWRLHIAHGLLGAIGSAVIDRGGRRLWQYNHPMLCPFGFSASQVFAGLRSAAHAEP